MMESLKNKSIVIAGATGLIGKCLVDLLMHKNETEGLNCHIFALSRSEGTARRRFGEKYFHSPFFTFQEYDVRDSLELSAIKHVDYVIHLASNTHPVAYAAEPIDTIVTNIYGTKNLLDFCEKYKARRFVFLSSVEIYGENRGDTEFFNEEYVGYLDSNTMRAGYPESKRCGEALCQAYLAEKGLDIVIVRLPRVYGPTMLEADSKAVAQFIRKAAGREDIVLKSKGDQHYSFLHVMDAVTGILTVMLNGKRGEAYNVADVENDGTLKQIAELAAGIAGTKVVYELPEETERKGYSTATKARLSGEKMRALGWRPKYTLRTGIQDTLDILRKG